MPGLTTLPLTLSLANFMAILKLCWGVDELLASMDRASVECAAVISGIAWANPEISIIVNNYLIEATSRFPKRLVAFVSVTPGPGRIYHC